MMITVSIVMAPDDPPMTMTAEEAGQKIMAGLGAVPPDDTCTVNIMHNPESHTIGPVDPNAPQVNPLTEATIPPPPSGPPPSLE